DNSPDGTYPLVRDTFQGDARVVPVLRTTDRGFAKSIRAGIEQARGDQILVMDTDFTHDPVEILRLLYFLQRRRRSVVELPASYLVRSAGKSKSRFFKMFFTYMWSAISLRVK